MMAKIYRIRGAIINDAIMVERLIDFYISNLYGETKEKATELRDWVFTERISFESKIQLFALVIDKHNSKFKKDNPDFLKELIHIVEQRNIFAHYLCFSDDEAMELFHKNGSLTFGKYKNDAKEIIYTTDQLKRVSDLIIKYIPQLMDLVEGTKRTSPSQT